MPDSKFCTVQVKDIAEYPTALGIRCQLLPELGLNTYWNTDEELYDALVQSAEKPECMKVCRASSRCSAFYEHFIKGVTPYNDRDPIRLTEYGGKYWAEEGKHRVCMAKRMGVETIEAMVWPQPTDEYTQLPTEGNAGTYVFESTHKCGRHYGDIAVLWLNNPRGNKKTQFEFYPVAVDMVQDTHGQWQEIFSGLRYRVSCTEKKRSLFRAHSIEVKTEVDICPTHYNTRLWLMRVCRNTSDIETTETVYRVGLWRAHHLNTINTKIYWGGE